MEFLWLCGRTCYLTTAGNWKDVEHGNHVYTVGNCANCGIRCFLRSYGGSCSRQCNGVYHSGDRSWHWRGDEVGYTALHNRVNRDRGPASNYHCHFCENTAEQWAMLHDTGGIETNDYVPSCVACHLRYDRGQLDTLI